MTTVTAEDPQKSEIQQFFADKNVFITGGSGFIGKVLIEKLLRSCPDLKSVILLMRAKKGKTVEERIEAITCLPLFDRLRKEQPQNIGKIRIITGDVSKLGLGLSNEDRALLTAETHIVFHAAASVRFDDPLRDAIILNTRGTRELVQLGLEMKQLQVLVHVSTTYCHTNLKVVGEELYPPPTDWREAIELAERADKQTLNILSKKYMGFLPNTYTFAKALAEHVVNDLCLGKLPATIVRPSIVISSMADPFPGWIDNFNGPVGLMVACGKGVLRSMYTDPNIVADYVPVDITVKGLIGAAWTKGSVENATKQLSDTTVYNISNNNFHPVTLGETIDIGKKLALEYPLNGILWYPDGGITTCIYNHFYRVIFYHLLPAIVIDAILKLAGHKPILMKVQRRIYTANMALSFFITNEWKFLNDESFKIGERLLPADEEIFGLPDEETMRDIVGFLTHATIGARKYLLKESDESFAQAKVHSRRMWFLHQVVNVLWYALIIWLFLKYVFRI